MLTPFFFLAGPIRGGGDWQQQMCLAIHRLAPECIIANPSRYEKTHSLNRYFCGTDDGWFKDQLDWERYYLELAGIGKGPGCIIFWLPEESTQSPHPGPEPYAMDTRGELGAWRTRMFFQDARVVVGAEAGFHGLSQIQRNFERDLGREFKVYSSMIDVVRAATVLMRR